MAISFIFTKRKNTENIKNRIIEIRYFKAIK